MAMWFYLRREERVPEERLACLVCKAHWNEHDFAMAHQLIAPTEFCWPTFWNVVRFNSVIAIAALKIEQLGEIVPGDICSEVERIHRQNLRRRVRLLAVLEELNRRDLPLFLLKGFLLGEQVYRNPFYKKMNDIDVLVRKEQAESVVDAFLQFGFRFVNEGFFSKKPIDFRLHHSPPLISDDQHTVIGLHWGLTSTYSSRHPTTDIFAGSKSFLVEGLYAHRMSDDHNLLHQCIHLPFFKVGLRELADVSNLLMHSDSEIDVRRVLDLAEKWRCVDALYRVVRLADAAIPCLSEEDRRQLLSLRSKIRSVRYLVDTEKRANDVSLLLRSRSVYIGQIEKHFVLFKLTKNYSLRAHHLKRQWAHFFFQPKEEQERLLLRGIAKASVMSRLKCAGAIWFGMAQSIGSFYLVVISVKNIFSVAKQRLRFGRRRDDPEEGLRIKNVEQFLEQFE